MGIALAIISGVVGALAERCFDAVVAWAKRHQARDAPVDDPIVVSLYGPDGELIREVRVEKGA
jgi:hypothetical protein